jgi:hypothetical protein
MSLLGFITVTAICTSSLAVSTTNPNQIEHVTRVFLDEHNFKVELKEYNFRAKDAWGLDNVEKLLVDANLTAPVRELEVEEVLNFTTDTGKTLELYNDDGQTWTMEAVLRLEGNGAEFEVEHDYKTSITKMTCRR